VTDRAPRHWSGSTDAGRRSAAEARVPGGSHAAEPQRQRSARVLVAPLPGNAGGKVRKSPLR